MEETKEGKELEILDAILSIPFKDWTLDTQDVNVYYTRYKEINIKLHLRFKCGHYFEVDCPNGYLVYPLGHKGMPILVDHLKAQRALTAEEKLNKVFVALTK